MRFKYSELLKVRKDLVLPVHMKTLMEFQRFIDETLNFIKRCRRQMQSVIYFSDIK